MKPIPESLNWEPVEVYRNLTQKCYSVRAGKPKRVVGHAKRLILTNCTFYVSQKGNERVRREHQKDVHAFIRGFLRSDLAVDYDYFWRNMDKTEDRISYNPYLVNQFCWALSDGKPDKERPIYSARIVILEDDRVLVKL